MQLFGLVTNWIREVQENYEPADSRKYISSQPHNNGWDTGDQFASVEDPITAVLLLPGLAPVCSSAGTATAGAYALCLGDCGLIEDDRRRAKGQNIVTSPTPDLHSQNRPLQAPLQEQVELEISDLMSSLPEPADLTSDQRRGIIARYTAVLEGNFIYWMTGALLATKSDEARSIILENLHEEVRDCHPGMMRRFAIAAQAAPTDADAEAVYRDLMRVRLFIGHLSAVPILVTMAFFEGFIQRFMAYLADLAQRQGSAEMEYTDVHGVCDITHTQELWRAISVETALNPPAPEVDLLEGVRSLEALIRTIVHSEAVQMMAA